MPFTAIPQTREDLGEILGRMKVEFMPTVYRIYHLQISCQPD